MAVTDVKEDWNSGVYQDGLGARRATRIYTVLLDGADALPARRPAAAIADDGSIAIPDLGDSYPNDLILRVNDKQVSPVGLNYYQVTVIYSTTFVDSEVEEQDPLDEPAKLSWSSIETVRLVEDCYKISNDTGFTYDDAATTRDLIVTNSSEEPFDPPLEEPQIDDILTITRNEADYDPTVQGVFRNSINLASYQGMAAHTILMADIRAENIIRGGDDYWRITYELHYRQDGWARRVSDRGFREIVDSSKTTAEERYADILDENTQKITEPAFLDGSGGFVNFSGGPIISPFWFRIQLNQVKDWASLSLPT